VKNGGNARAQADSKKGDNKMRKMGVLILVLLVLGVVANCAKEESGPAEATEEVLADSSEATALEQGKDDAEEAKADTTDAGKPKIVFEEKDFDFGKVETGEKVEKVYKFRNTGDATLVVHKVRSS
jgi:hypothetical protein